MNAKLCLFVLFFIASVNLVADQSDARLVIRLSEQHRFLVLTEMRQFLTGLQQISDALSRSDMEAVASAARALGSPMTHHMPVDLRQSLPEEFRMLGFSVHSDFDRIALDAEALGDPQHTLSQLSETLSRCVACHSAYQIRAAGDP